jgi:hypothetical protein
VRFPIPIRRHRTIDQSAGGTGVHPDAFTVGPEGDCFPAAHDGVPKIRQIATGGSHIHQISRVIDWIKGNLSERLRVEPRRSSRESPRNSVGRRAAEQGLAEEEALKKGMAEKSREFTGEELYAKA